MPTPTPLKYVPIPAGSTWDDRVDSWETVAESPAFQRFASEVQTLAAPRADDRVVDLGCGTGLLSLAFAPLVERVVAIDSSPAMLQRLAEKTATESTANIETVVADLRSLPLPDESATLAVSNYALHHLDDRGKELALSEIRRVLVPGGRLVICDMMFALSLRPSDVAVIGGKLALLARRGPAGLLRIARNGARIVTRRWEHPSPASSWEQMLAARHFTDIRVRLLEHEAGIALARRPSGTERLKGGSGGDSRI